MVHGVHRSVSPNNMIVMPFVRKGNMRGLKEPGIFCTAIQVSTEVKYFGTIVEKRLTWKSQLDKVTDAALRAFLTCRGSFS